MKKRHMALALLLMCSMAFFISYSALSSFADTNDSYVYASGSGVSHPMFTTENAGNMAPGDTASAVLHVKNDKAFTVRVTRLWGELSEPGTFSDSEPFLNSLLLTIHEDTVLPSSELYSGTMAGFLASEAALPGGAITLGAGEETEIIFDIVFSNQAGNECQGKMCMVDFIVQFEGDDGGDGGGDDDSDKDNDDNDGNNENNNDTSADESEIIVTSVEPPPPAVAPMQPETVNIVTVPPAVEPVIETLQQLPETGWAGMAGAGTAALLMAGAGLGLRHFSRRRWK